MGGQIEHIIPNLKEWPIYKLSKNREQFIEELNAYNKSNLLENSGLTVEELLEKTVYLEQLRVKNNPWSVDPADDKIYWKNISEEIIEAKRSDNPKEELDKILDRVINRYNEEIVGSFRIKTYLFARKFLTSFFKRIYNSFGESYKRGLWGNKNLLISKLNVIGDVERLRKLFNKGTIVLVPTHTSNIDSILLGYTIDTSVGVPAFVYGAGLNLYNYEIPAYFMNRLGTYRVDRRKKNPIYLECLKGMASYSLQKGVNNIFFPGGTRSRDGKIEQRLKLGLLGSVIEAQRNEFVDGDGQKIFLFPVIMSFNFVLEAQGLINQHLRINAKEKYTKPKDQAKQSGYIWQFMKALFSQANTYTLSIAPPMDVFGNTVDEAGRSINKDGDVLDIKGYFELDGSVQAMQQREKIYTKILGDKIAKSYLDNNVVLASQVLAYVGFKLLLIQHESLELYDVLNLDIQDFSIEKAHFIEAVESFNAMLRKMESEAKIKLHEEFNKDIEEFLTIGLEYLGDYHPSKVLYIDDEGQVKSENFRLLYYYHNRLDTYEFDYAKILT